MIPKGLFTQIILVLVSVGMVFFYIQPQFSYISETQDLIASYQEEREKVSFVNRQLDSLVDEMDEVSGEDQQRLFTYLPDTVDSISVQRDIKAIVDESGVIYRGVDYSEESGSAPEDDATVNTKSYPFTLSVEGTYSQIKTLLSLLERNQYPLEILELSLSALDGGFMSADLQLVTYGLESEGLVEEELDF